MASKCSVSVGCGTVVMLAGGRGGHIGTQPGRCWGRTVGTLSEGLGKALLYKRADGSTLFCKAPPSVHLLWSTEHQLHFCWSQSLYTEHPTPAFLEFFQSIFISITLNWWFCAIPASPLQAKENFGGTTYWKLYLKDLGTPCLFFDQKKLQHWSMLRHSKKSGFHTSPHKSFSFYDILIKESNNWSVACPAGCVVYTV